MFKKVLITAMLITLFLLSAIPATVAIISYHNTPASAIYCESCTATNRAIC